MKAADKLLFDGAFSSAVQSADETSVDFAPQHEMEGQLGADFDIEENDLGLRIGSDRFGDFAVSFDVGREACNLTAVVEAVDLEAHIALAGLRSIACSSTGAEAQFVFRLLDGGTMCVYLDSSIRVELTSALT